MNEETQEIKPFESSDLWSEPESERTTQTRVFNFAPAFGSKDIAITIYTDGMADAERWGQLSAATLYGHTQAMLATIQKTEYSETHVMPNGKKLIVTDPAYIGSLKVLSLMQKSFVTLPKNYTQKHVDQSAKAKDNAFRWPELLTFGHKAGKVFHDVLNWAAEVNGVTADSVAKMQELLGNALSQKE